MIRQRADEYQFDEAIMGAIEALPEPARSTLLNWVAETRQELAEVRFQGRDAGSRDELERRRLARELHDSIGTDLAASIALFKFYFEDTHAKGREDVLRNVFEMLETTLRSLRTMLRSLRSPEVGATGLVNDLRDMAKAYQGFHELDVLLEVSGNEDDLTRSQHEAVFHVVREALSNVRRHSQCLTCQVQIRFSDTPFRVVITDWGVGIVRQNPDGFGLIGMRERAAGIGGQLQVVTTRGRGTTITFTGPAPALA